MQRLLLLQLVGLIVTAVVVAQTRPAVDSLVAQVTRSWGTAPAGGWTSEWTVIRGDSTALSARDAELVGSDRSGTFTVTVRSTRFAAPRLVGRLRVGAVRAETVAAHTVPRGAALTSDDLRSDSLPVWGLRDSSTTMIPIAALVGSETRRVLREGEPVRQADVVQAPVVRVGDTITAEYMRDGVKLALVGTALQNAPLGGRVAIRLDRGRRLAGIAVGRNTVRLD